MATLELTSQLALPVAATIYTKRTISVSLRTSSSKGIPAMASLRATLPAASGARRQLLARFRPWANAHQTWTPVRAMSSSSHAKPATGVSSAGAHPDATSDTGHEDQGDKQLQRRDRQDSRAVAKRGSRDLAYPRGFGGFPDLWGPLAGDRTLRGMLDLVDRMFQDFLPAPVTGGTGDIGRALVRVPWDVKETDKEYKIRIDMPGLNKDEIKMRVEDNTLIINGEHKVEGDDKGDERAYASYQTRVVLPDDADEEHIRAELKDGVLYVTVPKDESKKQQKHKEIPVS